MQDRPDSETESLFARQKNESLREEMGIMPNGSVGVGEESWQSARANNGSKVPILGTCTEINLPTMKSESRRP